MCGLFGLYRPQSLSPGEIARADAARDTLHHRGPDWAGKWTADGLYIGFRRLSILDLTEAGRQPMVSVDGRTVITVNGEIYNFRQLRAELIGAGHVFRSQSDSEVVLHGYRQWGIERLCEKLDGMYAALIYDSDRRLIHAIRDRAGMKPLFYFHAGRSFAWASELKALEAWWGNDCPAVDETALLDFLAVRYIPAPKSVYRSVAKLPPASRLTFDTSSGSVQVRRYWTLPTELCTGSDDELSDELQDRIQTSVESHMISDVPVGYLLSGGIDSAVVMSHAIRVNPKATAFSIGFDDPSHDETRYAKIISRRFGVDHKIKVLERDEIDDIFVRTRRWYDEPFSDAAAVPMFRVSEFARADVTVALTGDGGDELFGGYRWYNSYNEARKKLRWAWLISRFRSGGGHRAMLRNARDSVELYAIVRHGLPKEKRDAYRREWNIPKDYDELWHFREWWKPELGLRRSLQYLDFHTYLPNNIFTKVDRLSMAVSLEARIPFMARSVIEYAFSLPETFIFRGGVLKGGLKYAYRKTLPQEILERPKQGFSIPSRSWKKAAIGMKGTYQEAVLREFIDSGKLQISVPSGIE